MESIYCREMKSTRPVATQIDATFSRCGHYSLKTPLTLSGRGVRFCEVLTAERLSEYAQHKAGWNEYYVTAAAYKRICREFAVSREIDLD